MARPSKSPVSEAQIMAYIYEDIDDSEIFTFKPSQENVDSSDTKVNSSEELFDIQTSEIVNENRDLKIKLKMLEEQKSLLELRLSEIYNTAKAEIERKDRRIRELNDERNDILFRRNRNTNNYYNGTNKLHSQNDDNHGKLNHSSEGAYNEGPTEKRSQANYHSRYDKTFSTTTSKEQKEMKVEGQKRDVKSQKTTSCDSTRIDKTESRKDLTSNLASKGKDGRKVEIEEDRYNKLQTKQVKSTSGNILVDRISLSNQTDHNASNSTGRDHKNVSKQLVIKNKYIENDFPPDIPEPQDVQKQPELKLENKIIKPIKTTSSEIKKERIQDLVITRGKNRQIAVVKPEAIDPVSDLSVKNIRCPNSDVCQVQEAKVCTVLISEYESNLANQHIHRLNSEYRLTKGNEEEHVRLKTETSGLEKQGSNNEHQQKQDNERSYKPATRRVRSKSEHYRRLSRTNSRSPPRSRNRPRTPPGSPTHNDTLRSFRNSSRSITGHPSSIPVEDARSPRSTLPGSPPIRSRITSKSERHRADREDLIVVEHCLKGHKRMARTPSRSPPTHKHKLSNPRRSKSSCRPRRNTLTSPNWRARSRSPPSTFRGRLRERGRRRSIDKKRSPGENRRRSRTKSRSRDKDNRGRDYRLRDNCGNRPGEDLRNELKERGRDQKQPNGQQKDRVDRYGNSVETYRDYKNRKLLEEQNQQKSLKDKVVKSSADGGPTVLNTEGQGSGTPLLSSDAEQHDSGEESNCSSTKKKRGASDYLAGLNITNLSEEELERILHNRLKILNSSSFPADSIAADKAEFDLLLPTKKELNKKNHSETAEINNLNNRCPSGNTDISVPERPCKKRRIPSNADNNSGDSITVLKATRQSRKKTEGHLKKGKSRNAKVAEDKNIKVLELDDKLYGSEICGKRKSETSYDSLIEKVHEINKQNQIYSKVSKNAQDLTELHNQPKEADEIRKKLKKSGTDQKQALVSKSPMDNDTTQMECDIKKKIGIDAYKKRKETKDTVSSGSDTTVSRQQMEGETSCNISGEAAVVHQVSHSNNVLDKDVTTAIVPSSCNSHQIDEISSEHHFADSRIFHPNNEAEIINQLPHSDKASVNDKVVITEIVPSCIESNEPDNVAESPRKKSLLGGDCTISVIQKPVEVYREKNKLPNDSHEKNSFLHDFSLSEDEADTDSDCKNENKVNIIDNVVIVGPKSFRSSSNRRFVYNEKQNVDSEVILKNEGNKIVREQDVECIEQIQEAIHNSRPQTQHSESMNCSELNTDELQKCLEEGDDCNKTMNKPAEEDILPEQENRRKTEREQMIHLFGSDSPFTPEVKKDYNRSKNQAQKVRRNLSNLDGINVKVIGTEGNHIKKNKSRKKVQIESFRIRDKVLEKEAVPESKQSNNDPEKYPIFCNNPNYIPTIPPSLDSRKQFAEYIEKQQAEQQNENNSEELSNQSEISNEPKLNNRKSKAQQKKPFKIKIPFPTQNGKKNKNTATSSKTKNSAKKLSNKSKIKNSNSKNDEKSKLNDTAFTTTVKNLVELEMKKCIKKNKKTKTPKKTTGRTLEGNSKEILFSATSDINSTDNVQETPPEPQLFSPSVTQHKKHFLDPQPPGPEIKSKENVKEKRLISPQVTLIQETEAVKGKSPKRITPIKVGEVTSALEIATSNKRKLSSTDDHRPVKTQKISEFLKVSSQSPLPHMEEMLKHFESKATDPKDSCRSITFEATTKQTHVYTNVQTGSYNNVPFQRVPSSVLEMNHLEMSYSDNTVNQINLDSKDVSMLGAVERVILDNMNEYLGDKSLATFDTVDRADVNKMAENVKECTSQFDFANMLGASVNTSTPVKKLDRNIVSSGRQAQNEVEKKVVSHCEGDNLATSSSVLPTVTKSYLTSPLKRDRRRRVAIKVVEVPKAT